MTEIDRQAIEDGRWFDKAKAKEFDEDTWHDGRNHISTPTGSQWDHESLWRTKGGVWVLQTYSNYGHINDTWTVTGDDAAAAWLVKNKHEPHEACKEEYALLEIK
jgi:hypothetical protein